MVIRVTCACGKRMQFPDEAAGKKSTCRQCATSVRIPQPEKSEGGENAEFTSLLDDVLQDVASMDSIEPDVEARQFSAAGEITRRPAPCPFCGQRISRSSVQCRHCKRSLRTGNCACCGAPVDKSNAKPACRCKANVVVWGSGQFGGLCTNCGRVFGDPEKNKLPTTFDIYGWSSDLLFTKHFTNESNAVLRPCVWCAVDRLIENNGSVGKSRKTADSEFTGTHATHSKPKTDEWRLRQLDRIIKTLHEKLLKAVADANQEKRSGGGGDVLGAVVVGALTGSTGFGAAFGGSRAAHREARINEESGVTDLEQNVGVANRIRHEFCLVAGIIDEKVKAVQRQKKMEKGLAFGCLGIIVIVAVIIVVVNAVSYFS